MWIKKEPHFSQSKECSLLNKRMNTCESPLAIYLHMLDEIHDGMEVHGDNLLLHIQQGKYSICIDERKWEVVQQYVVARLQGQVPTQQSYIPTHKHTGAI